MVLLAVPSRTRHHHCGAQTRGQWVVQIPYLCRPAVLSEGWHPFFVVGSCLGQGWHLCVAEVIAPSRARGSCREGLC